MPLQMLGMALFDGQRSEHAITVHKTAIGRRNGFVRQTIDQYHYIAVPVVARRMNVTLNALKDESAVRPTEAERIRHGHINLHRPRYVGHVV